MEWLDVKKQLLEVNEHQVNTLITEANYAFRLNMYIFDELQGDAKKSLLKVLWGVYELFLWIWGF